MRRTAESSRLLRQAGLRPTAARQRVLSSLRAAGRSLSHAELASLLRGLDRVTIFRSLKNLKKARLVHSVQGIDGARHYVSNPTTSRGCPGGHAHFYCLTCRALTCLLRSDMPVVRVPAGAEVHGKQFLVYGVCSSCAVARGPGPSRRTEDRRTR